MAATYNNLYLDARQRLRAAGVESAQLEAREIVCYAAEKTREQFYRDAALYASGQVEARVAELIERRLAGEPVAYIIGEWEFYGLTLDITRDVLIPRMDTEVLADVSEAALQVCKRNVRRNDLNARVTCVHADALQPPAAALWDFDVIACNPPYIPTGDLPGLDVSVRDYEPHLALDGGDDGLDYYRAIAGGWKSALRLGGALLFEVGMGQAPDVETLLAKNGYENIQTYQDTAGIWRVVEGVANN